MPSLADGCSITAWLSLESGRLSADEMTNRLGMPADCLHAIGDRLGKGERTWQVNQWKVIETSDVTREGHYEAIEETVGRLLKRIGPVADRFKQLAEECSGQLFIGTVSVGVPGLHLGRAMLSQVAALGVELEIDIIRVEDDQSDG